MTEAAILSATDAPGVEDQQCTLLFVDDEANILSALKRLFRPSGHRVLTAEGGEEAIAVLEKERVDLIISDMRMPGMTGAQVLATARSRWPDAVRILLTGYADINSTIEAINSGQLHRYISKPWDDNEMMLIVREALERKSLLGEKARLEALTQQQNEELKTLNSSLEHKVADRTQELATANEKLKVAFLNTIKTFSNLIELRGGQMAGHSRRVADYARRIGTQMHLSHNDLQNLFFASLLHDIGKIGYPDPLLTKPQNTLTADERNEVVKHPAKSEALLMGLEQLRGAARLIRHHHERWDGGGYPDGLAGAAIPLGARILSVANEYDGAQNGLLFAKRATPEEAFNFLHGGRGKRHDPAVLDAFEAMLSSTKKVEPEAHPLHSEQLQTGMMLAKDLVTRDGVLLLSHGYLLDETLIQQIHSYELSEGYKLRVYVSEGK